MTGPFKKFAELLGALKTHAASGGKTDGSAHAWFKPPGLQGDPADPANVRSAFDREQQNAAAEQTALKGSTGRAAGMKFQIDYVACSERAFHLRHMTPVRAAAHAAARRKGHAEPDGVFLGEVMPHAQNLLAAGGSR